MFDTVSFTRLQFILCQRLSDLPLAFNYVTHAASLQIHTAITHNWELYSPRFVTPNPPRQVCTLSG
jgi:hypothetical protein